MGSGYTDDQNRFRKVEDRQRTRTLFNSPPKHPRLAKDVMISSPGNARKSVEYLRYDWAHAKTREQKRDLVWAANEAANRAKASARKKDLSEHTRAEMLEVHGIFRAFVDEHKGTY